MTPGRQPRAWLLMAVGENRQYGGNAGYDDQPDAYYSWDSTVSNHANIQPGDAVALWDKTRLLGVSVVEDIERTPTSKLLLRCPNAACRRSNINSRVTKRPRYRCQDCGSEFEQPSATQVDVIAYTARHDAAWTALEGLLSGPDLRRLCLAPKSQLSMRELDWMAFSSALRERGAARAAQRVSARTPDLMFDRGPGSIEFVDGHRAAMVRVRRGQQAFRASLVAEFGTRCAFTGDAPSRALEAGHLYSYADLGQHHQHGGLLLRRDIHRLFDDGALAVSPDSLRVHVSAELEEFPQYARLHDRSLTVDLNDKRIEWLGKHWNEHRLGH